MSRGAFLDTYTGGEFYPYDPRVDEVRSEDIAHALSLICRYNGHVRYLWSVGQHCMFVSAMARSGASNEEEAKRMGWLGLIHDFHEAYTGDIIRPIKINIQQWGAGDWLTDMERKIDRVIYQALEIEPPTKEEKKTIKFYDNKALYYEINALLQKQPQWLDEFRVNYVDTSEHAVKSPLLFTRNSPDRKIFDKLLSLRSFQVSSIIEIWIYRGEPGWLPEDIIDIWEEE